MRIVNSTEMSEIDNKAQRDFLIPDIVLMENAGIKLHYFLLNSVWNGIYPGKAVYLAGKGNNGGDALVMARQHFTAGGICEITVPGTDSGSTLFRKHLDICRSLGIPVHEWEGEADSVFADLSESDWIIDGLSGTGLKGELNGSPAEIASAVNRSRAMVCSIDTPSGIGDSYREGYPSVTADVTLTVELPKFSLFTPSGRKKCGLIYPVPIGFPNDLIRPGAGCNSFLGESDIPGILPAPSPYLYKNKKGHTLVIAGSKGFSGAALLCSKAAINSMSGLVSLKVTPNIYTIVSSASAESVMVDTIDPGSYEKLPEGKYSSVVIGPGWDTGNTNRKWLKSFLQDQDIPCVIDAGGIKLLSELFSDGFELNNTNCIITPHIGEFALITGADKKEILDNPLPLLKEFSAGRNITVILKSHVVWIADSRGRVTVVDGMNPAMATAGSGDILSGITGGLISYGLDTETASVLAVLLHQKAGRMCYNDKGFFSAEKLPGYIGKAIKESMEK